MNLEAAWRTMTMVTSGAGIGYAAIHFDDFAAWPTLACAILMACILLAGLFEDAMQ